MTNWTVRFFLIVFFLLLLIAKEKNDGQKGLFINQKWKIVDVISIVIFFYVLTYLFNYILIEYFIDFPYYLKWTSFGIVYLISFLGLIILFKVKIKQNIKTLGLNIKNLKNSFFYGIISGFFIYIVAFIISSFTDTRYLLLFKEIFAFKNIINLQYFIIYFLLFFCIVIIAPIVEEIIFRGLLYSPYRKRYGPFAAIIITSLIFSLSHPITPLILPSIIFCLLYEKTESIYSSIISHIFANLFLIYLPLY